jgi:hypothetical protein
MLRRSALMIVVGLAMLLAAGDVEAGGWATVKLDSELGNVRTGQIIRIGFTVLQHGVTPIDSFGSEPLKPFLTARNKLTGQTMRVDATKQGLTGHFVAEIAFYKEGAWEWEITPSPFQATKFSPLTVLPAPVGNSVQLTRAAVALEAQQMWWLLFGVLVAVVVLLGFIQRRELRQWLLVRTGDRGAS